MDGSTSLSAEAPPEASSAERRLRALGRKVSRGFQRLLGRQPVEGFVDKVLAGEVRGWALDPNRPGRRVHVVARCDGRIVAEALADLPRRDLLADGRGDGRCAFALRLPAALLDGAPRRVRVEAQTGLWRTRLVGGDLRLGQGATGRAARGSSALPPEAGQPGLAVIDEEPCAALLIWGEASEEAAAATLASWSAQDWGRTAVARTTPGGAGAEELRRAIAGAHTVALARAGDVIDPSLARVLVKSRPLADVVTWDVPGGAGRRPWGRALGVLLGESLGGSFAVRGHVLAGLTGKLDGLAGEGDPRALELRLAAEAGLRWTHLPAQMAARAAAIGGWSPVSRAQAEGLEDFDWLSAEGDQPARLEPRRKAERITLGVWPAADEAVEARLEALAPSPGGPELEILVPAGAAPGLQDRLRAAAGEAGALITVRPVDPPRRPGPGGWLRALGQAASGEALVVFQASVRASLTPLALREIAAWTLSPLVGTASLDIALGGGGRLAGLDLVASEDGWRAASAFDPARAGQRRAVAAAPQAFLAVARDKLAALGGFDADRFPEQGADLDLALRLRGMGACSVLFGDLRASAPPSPELGGELSGAAMAPFDAAALAAAQAPPP